MSFQFEGMKRADNFDVMVHPLLKNLYIPFAFDLSQGYKLVLRYDALDLTLI